MPSYWKHTWLTAYLHSKGVVSESRDRRRLVQPIALDVTPSVAYSCIDDDVVISGFLLACSCIRQAFCVRHFSRAVYCRLIVAVLLDIK